MKTYITAIVVFLTVNCFGQVSHVFSINSETYTITFSKNSKNYDFNLLKIGNENEIKNFTLPKLEIVTFKNVIFQTLDSLNTDPLIRNDLAINKTIDQIFYTTVANIETVDDLNYAPVAGVVKISDEVFLYTDKIHSPSIKLDGLKFKISNTQFVFQNGFIQDVIVDGIIIEDKNSKKDDRIDYKQFINTELRFSNYYGIGFSSKKNIRNLFRINLYPNYKSSYNKNLLFTKKWKEKDKNTGNEVEKTETKNLFEYGEVHIKLGEVIKAYDYRNDLYTNDYSPANVKVTIDGGKSETLYKDKTYKILEARVFSDFLGFNSEKPNGLLQFEVEKQFNFNTTRYKFLTYKLRSGIGTMEYLKIVGGVSKIEENNRYLIPKMEDIKTVSFAGDSILVNKRYSTPIDVLNHQTWNIGVQSNIALIDMPLIKSQLHLNAGFRFAQTKVQDSIKTLNTDSSISSTVRDYNLHYWLFYPEFIWHVLPETRYGLYASWRPKFFHSITDGIEYYGLKNQLSSERRDNISNWISEYELLCYLFVNQEKQNGKLFVRWRLNAEMGYTKNNFSQFQVGYSFYILGRGRQE